MHCETAHGRNGPARSHPGSSVQEDHHVGSGSSQTSGPGRTGLHRRPTQPVVDLGHHLCGHMVRVRLCVLCHRRVLEEDRRLASLHLAAHRPGPRRSRTGDLGPARSRGQTPDTSFRRRRATPVHPLHRTTRRSRDRTLGRVSRRQLRQQHGRISDRPLQDRAHQEPRTMAEPRHRRVRHPGMGRLVEQPPNPRTHRKHPTRRKGGQLLPPKHPGQHGRTHVNESPAHPDRFTRPPVPDLSPWELTVTRMGDFKGQALDLLRKLTGRSNADFRAGQLEATRAVVQDRASALVVQATGWGKSAVYFISTKMIRASGGGPTVIVSPLLALMRNQKSMAESLDLSVALFNSQTHETWPLELERIESDVIDLAFVTPETLNNPEFGSTIRPKLFNRVGLLVIDEVHCISEWGHDFRPDYRRLRDVVSTLPPGIPVLGTTATANDRVITDVEAQLGTGMETFRGPLGRESLKLQVLEMPNKAHRMAWLAEALPG